MRKLRHSKFKNTGILFELLTRQLTSDLLNKKDSFAIGIINDNFKKSSNLLKELELYKALTENQFNNVSKAKALLETVLKARKKINQKSLTKEKYSLIKDIKDHYNIDDFFSHRVRNYKEIASIYKIFEYNSSENPADIVNSKFTVLEHITSSRISQESKDHDISAFSQADEDLRLLSYKILVDRFNEKYSGLNKKQKDILKEYINNVSNSQNLKRFVLEELKGIETDLNKYIPKVKDKVTQIKLKEVKNLTSKLKRVRVIKDSHVLSLLRYYELIKELKSI
tara:strand:- start:889 stop:1734 length:846 start_codon:yes stop_codon:yes gene_type:complete